MTQVPAVHSEEITDCDHLAQIIREFTQASGRT